MSETSARAWFPEAWVGGPVKLMANIDVGSDQPIYSDQLAWVGHAGIVVVQDLEEGKNWPVFYSWGVIAWMHPTAEKAVKGYSEN